MRQRHRTHLALAIAAALSLAPATVALAAPQATAEDAAVRRFEIAAQPLAAALRAFAEQAGLQVVYASGGIPGGGQGKPVSGDFTPAEALRRLLDGSGLEAEFVNARTVMIRDGRARSAATSDGDVRELEQVTVTGSRLVRIDPATPMIAIDAETISRRGFSSIEDVLRHLPQNLASRSSVSTALMESEFGDGAVPSSPIGSTAVNLRGLGSRSTLVLVNGRRRAASAQSMGAFTDISSIPISQVERIEVLTDGASAIYGADAVAGVINIILKKDYQGTVVDLRHEWSSSDADAVRASLGHSFAFAQGSLTLAAAVERSESADLNRYVPVGPSGRGDFTHLNGSNTRKRGFGQPGTVHAAFEIFDGMYVPYMELGVVPGGQDGSNLQPWDICCRGIRTTSRPRSTRAASARPPSAARFGWTATSSSAMAGWRWNTASA